MLLSRVTPPQAELGSLPPPLGIPVDLNQPDTNLYRYNVASQVLCYVLVGASVLARTYTKIFIKRTLGAEDCKLLPIPVLSPPEKLINGRHLPTGMGWSLSLFTCRDFHLTISSCSRLYSAA